MMRSIIACLSFFSTLFLACEQNPRVVVPETNCGIRIKIVHHTCGYIFAQILDQEYAVLADSEWRAADNTVYKNVFIVSNPCIFFRYPAINDHWDDEFKVSIVREDTTTPCMRCYIGYPANKPETNLNISFCSNDEAPGT